MVTNHLLTGMILQAAFLHLAIFTESPSFQPHGAIVGGIHAQFVRVRNRREVKIHEMEDVGVSKNGGYPKMDGENNGKPYLNG